MSIRSFLRRRPAPRAGEFTGHTMGTMCAAAAPDAARPASAAGRLRAATAASVEALEGRLFLSTTPDPASDVTPPTARVSGPDITESGVEGITILSGEYFDNVRVDE